MFSYDEKMSPTDKGFMAICILNIIIMIFLAVSSAINHNKKSDYTLIRTPDGKEYLCYDIKETKQCFSGDADYGTIKLEQLSH